MKKLVLFAAVITVGCVIAIFAGSGEDTGVNIQNPKLATSTADVPQLINYQGILTDGGGNPLDATVSMTFTIYDAQSGGTTLWTETHGSVTVVGGLFTVLLGSVTPIPSTIFDDPDRWLGLAVGGDPEMERERMASVPYAFKCGSGDGGEDIYVNEAGPDSMSGNSGSSILTVINSGNGDGIRGETHQGTGGVAGVFGRCTSSLGTGVFGLAERYGVYGQADDTGVKGDASGNTGKGVVGIASGDKSWGVYGQSPNVGVNGRASDMNSVGVSGSSHGEGGTGVDGSCVEEWGSGVYGIGGYIGTAGQAYDEGGVGIYGAALENGTWAGYFEGDVHITGTINPGCGASIIDHPLDPASKYLYHSFVESPDMMNVYNGNVILNAEGEAVVELPHYFQALNRDFRYQLTCIGDFAPVYIKEEISNNRFKIAGGSSGMKVSWQVTGIRQDAYANAHRNAVEVEKSDLERGKYAHPKEHGMPETEGIDYARFHDK